MAISFIDATTAVNNPSFPTHQAGDIILAFAYRDGNNTAPTLPSGWTEIGATGGNTNSSRIAWRRATTSSETSDAWTNATQVIYLCYRGCLASGNPIGGFTGGGAQSTTVSYPAVTMTDAGGSSWVVGVAGHRSTNTSLENAPTGMTQRLTQVDATDEVAAFDTNGGVTSWSAQSVSVGGSSSGWRSWTIELLAQPVGFQPSWITHVIRPSEDMQIAPIEFASATGSSTNTDPPNLEPSAGEKDYLWLATRHGAGTTTASAAPSGFTQLQTIAASAAYGSSTNTAERQETATSLNPAAYTSASAPAVAFTVAVWQEADDGALEANNVRSNQTINTGAVSQTHVLTGNSVRSNQNINTGAVTQTQTVTGNNVKTDQTVNTGAVSQTHQLTGNSAKTDQTINTGAISSEHDLAANSVRSDQTITTGAISSEHSLDANNVKTDQTITTGAVEKVHVLTANSVKTDQTINTGAVSSEHGLSGNNTKTDQTINTGAVSSEHTLSANNAKSDQTITTGATDSAHTLAANNVKSDQTVSTGSVSQESGLIANSVKTDQTITTGAVEQTHVLTGNSVAQSNTINDGAVDATVTHTLTGNNAKSDQTINTGAVSSEHTASANNVAQPTTINTGAVSSEHSVSANNVAQPNTINSGAVTQEQTLSGNDAAQPNTINTGSVTSEHTLTANNVEQQTTVSSGAVFSDGYLSGNNPDQPNTITSGAITQTISLTANDVDQPNVIAYAPEPDRRAVDIRRAGGQTTPRHTKPKRQGWKFKLSNKTLKAYEPDNTKVPILELSLEFVKLMAEIHNETQNLKTLLDKAKYDAVVELYNRMLEKEIEADDEEAILALNL